MKPVVIKPEKVISGTKYIENFKFKSRHEVPIYEVTDCSGLNQIIGYIKLINKSYGKVFYRGQCDLYDTMLPSLYHGNQSLNIMQNKNKRLNKIIINALKDKKISKETHLKADDPLSLIVMEGMLQHYGINTRCIDAIDNHWIGLWFGLNKYYTERIGNVTYATYTNRMKNCYQLFNDMKIASEELSSFYQYLILLAADKKEENNGVVKGEDLITVDLRVALPSTFLRPHAQHGVILKKNLHKDNCDFDISNNVVGILKIRNDKAQMWLGDGELVKFNNLFPSQFHDYAYRILLEREDLFNDGVNSIVQYIYE